MEVSSTNQLPVALRGRPLATLLDASNAAGSAIRAVLPDLVAASQMRHSPAVVGFESLLEEKYTKQELQLVGRVLDDCIQLLKGTTWFPPAPRRLDSDD